MDYRSIEPRFGTWQSAKLPMGNNIGVDADHIMDYRSLQHEDSTRLPFSANMNGRQNTQLGWSTPHWQNRNNFLPGTLAAGDSSALMKVPSVIVSGPDAIHRVSKQEVQTHCTEPEKTLMDIHLPSLTDGDLGSRQPRLGYSHGNPTAPVMIRIKVSDRKEVPSQTKGQSIHMRTFARKYLQAGPAPHTPLPTPCASVYDFQEDCELDSVSDQEQDPHQVHIHVE